MGTNVLVKMVIGRLSPKFSISNFGRMNMLAMARPISVRANDSETQTPLEFRPYGAEG
jgi:hypothetical protein